METDKWFLASKTILGLLATILPTLLPLIGIESGLEDGQLFTTFFDSMITLAGAAMALYGRFVASTSLRLGP